MSLGGEHAQIALLGEIASCLQQLVLLQTAVVTAAGTETEHEDLAEFCEYILDQVSKIQKSKVTK